MANKTQKKESMLWIEATEKVKYSIGLEIGKDISEEDADRLLNLTQDEEEFDVNTKGYGELSSYLTPDLVTDSEGYEDVYVHQSVKLKK